MLSIINKHRNKIMEHVKMLLEDSKTSSIINNEKINSLLLEFIGRGKLIRGALIAETYYLFSEKNEEEIYKMSAAIELIHSSLLLHDDIMDKSDKRRDAPSMHKYYEAEAEKLNYKEAEHLGESISMCLGDILIFLGFKAINDSKIAPEIKTEIFHVFSEELVKVGEAQMHDIRMSYSPKDPSEEEILEMYKHKTARYTFSLPLKVGALLAGKKEEAAKLEKLGEIAGLVFQLKDDEIGIAPSAEVTGKSNDSDIKQDKKTVHRARLIKKLSEEEKKKALSILGKNNASHEEVLAVKNLFEKKGIIQEIRLEMKNKMKSAYEILDTINIPDERKAGVIELLKFISEREK